MSDDFETLVAHGKALYGDLVARSWEIMVAQTDATSPAAIEATCDLQRNLVVAGAEWIALCERVLAVSTAGEATTSFALPASASGTVDSAIASPALESALPSLRVERSQTPRTRTQARTNVAAPDQSATMLPIPQPESNGVGSRRTANAPLNGQTAYRIFPLVLDAAPAHVQLVAMSFNGAEWHPIAAWRRIYQQVIQSLQRSDPERFDTLATTLTMSNGRPLFSRDRSVYMAPIDAGGGWFATGQMPTELILQRLRMLVDWWGLPRESLSVEVMPEARAPLAVRPDDEQPASSGDTTITPGIASEPEPSMEARAEDLRSYSEQSPDQSHAKVAPVDADIAVPPTDDVSTGVAALENETTSPAAVEAPMELVTSGALEGVRLEGSTADEVEQKGRPSDTDEVPVAAADVNVPEEANVADDVLMENVETVAAQEPGSPVSVETLISAQTGDTAEQAPPMETPIAQRADDVSDQPSEETLAEVLPPIALDPELAETIDVEAGPATEPESFNDPVNGSEAHVIQAARGIAPAPVNEVVQPPHVLPDAQPQVALAEEFTPPPTAQPSNVRWVKTINGTRLPLRPATED